jgi:hypothetical protein
MKPWEYKITAAIPHLNTIEPLKICVKLLLAQSERPYILIIDTGSTAEALEELAAMRADNVEIHFISAHAYRHASEPVAVALDLAQSLCRSERLFHTHSDCFLRRSDFLADTAKICGPSHPVVGYRLSPRNWATTEWEWMVGHTATMCYMPTIHRIGATWSFQRIHHAFGIPWHVAPGWPDTEVGFNYALREAGILPVFIGCDRNFERQVDDNIDHVRSFSLSKLNNLDYFEQAKAWMEIALEEGRRRLEGQVSS